MEYGVLCYVINSNVYTLDGKLWIFSDIMHGWCLFGKNKIEVFQNHNLPWNPTLAACIIAHELGHHIDWLSLDNYDRRTYSVALKMKPRISKEKKKWPTLSATIFNAESRAWDNAFKVLKLHKFDEWDFFFAVRDYCLGTYMNSFHVR